jgi:hypothetical protein
MYYKSIKKIIDGVDSSAWGKIRVIDKDIVDQKKTKRCKRPHIVSLLNMLFFRSCKNVYVNGNDRARVAFYKSMYRDDYNKLFLKIHSLADDRIVIDVVECKKIYSIYNALYILLCLIKSKKYNDSFEACSFIEKITYYLKSALHVKKVLPLAKYNFKALIVFADMQPCDHIAVEWCKANGTKTYTLQHGLYIDYSSLPNVNEVNYMNHNADYFLSWGKHTKELINKYHPQSKVIICGKPIMPERELVELGTCSYLTVIFDQNLLEKFNVKMLGIAYFVAEKLGLKVNVRLHPYNTRENYNFTNTTLFNRDLFCSKFIIAHTTAMIHELLRMGIPIYKYKSHIPALDIPDELVFNDADELINMVGSNYISSDKLKEFGKEFIEYINDDAQARYQKVLSSI